MEPATTPERRLQKQPDTEPKRLRTPSPPPKNKGGRPPSRKAKRPPPLLEFRDAGPPTAEGWGYIRAVAERGNHSIRDLAAMFNVSKSSIHLHLNKKLGDFTMSEQGRGRAERVDCALDENAVKVAKVLEQFPLASVRDVAAKSGLCRTTACRALAHGGHRSMARPSTPYSGGDHAAWAARRVAFCRTTLKDPPKRTQLLFVDECLMRVSTEKCNGLGMRKTSPREKFILGARVAMCGVASEVLVLAEV